MTHKRGGQSAKSLKMANIQLAQIIKNLPKTKKKDIITKLFLLVKTFMLAQHHEQEQNKLKISM